MALTQHPGHRQTGNTAANNCNPGRTPGINLGPRPVAAHSEFLLKVLVDRQVFLQGLGYPSGRRSVIVRIMIRQWQQRQRTQLRAALNAPACSRWENLGLWSRADQPYADAARALALRVGTVAGLQSGDSVLDIGPGQTTEQLKLWSDKFEIGAHYGWEADSPAPAPRSWQHVLAVDSAYFVPELWPRWQSLWPQLNDGGAITWTDLYLAAPLASWRSFARLRLTSALASIPWRHWRSRDQWLHRLSTLPGATTDFEDLTDEVLGGFVRHMQWRQRTTANRAGLRLAYGTAALLEPLLSQGVIGYGLFQARRKNNVTA
jgi:hypothetical protein